MVRRTIAIRRWGIVLGSLACAALSYAPTASAADLTKQIDQLSQPYVDSETVVGMSIGVLYDGKSLVRGYGKLAADDPRTPDGRTIYEIGSVTKVFTGLLLADAVVAERVSLTTPVDQLLPRNVKLRRADPERPIELSQLSTHTSGLPRLPDNLKPADSNNPYADYDEAALLAFLNGYQPPQKPGAAIAYSNLGVGLLGYLLARERSVDYDALLQQRIAQPLEMPDTRIKLNAAQQQRLAAPHLDGGAPGRNWDLDALAGAGAIRSDVDDMLKFAAANLHPDDQPLGKAIELAWAVHQQPLAGKDFAMGLGWHVARDGATRWHNGQTGGYHAAIFLNRKLDIAVVVLANTATAEIDVLAEQLMRLLAGAKEEPRLFPKLVKVPAETLKSYAGKYQLAPGALFNVTAEDDKLLVGLTGQPTFRVYPRSATEWYYKVVEATLTFQVDDQGKCNAVELFQNGARLKAKRIE